MLLYFYTINMHYNVLHKFLLPADVFHSVVHPKMLSLLSTSQHQNQTKKLTILDRKNYNVVLFPHARFPRLFLWQSHSH